MKLKNKKGKTPLLYVIKESSFRLEVITFLIEKGANIESQDEHGWTALHFASRDANLEIVRLLLKKGANIEIKNDKGETPIDIAEKNFDKKLVKFFKNFQKKDK